jgi:hypothetical protein
MGEGIVLERRAPSGALRQLIRRDVPWLPLGGYNDLPSAPQFLVLEVDREGVLWLAVGAKDRRWTATAPGSPPLPEFDQMDVRLEVVDPDRQAVLASVRFDTLDTGNLPPIYPVVPFNRLTWAIRTEADGFRSIHLYNLHLRRARQ